MLKQSEKAYCEKLLFNVKGNLRKTWAILNALTSKKEKPGVSEFLNIKNNIVSDKHAIVTAFNDYFVDIGKNLASDIKPVSAKFDQYLYTSVMCGYTMCVLV